MYSNQISDIESFAKSIKRGTFGLYAATFTEKKMNKYPNGTSRKDYKTTPVNPYLDANGNSEVYTLAFYQNAATGLNYYNIVKSECEKEGIHFTDEEFAIAFPKQETYCSAESDDLSNIILKKNDSEQKYLRLYNGRKPTKVVYFTIYKTSIVPEGSALMADILRYVSPKKESAKQSALGITNIVEVKQPKVENVVFLAQGDDFYINPRFGIMELFNIENIRKMFSPKK